MLWDVQVNTLFQKEVPRYNCFGCNGAPYSGLHVVVTKCMWEMTELKMSLVTTERLLELPVR